MFKDNKFVFFAAIVLIFVSIIGFKVLNSGSEENKNSEVNTSALKQVDSKYVCMVTDKLFNKEQISVEVEGKTYYGCCDMCKGRLANDPDIRIGIDPISKKKVDKAQSVTAADSEGEIYYFEDKQNLVEFNKIMHK